MYDGVFGVAAVVVMGVILVALGVLATLVMLLAVLVLNLSLSLSLLVSPFSNISPGINVRVLAPFLTYGRHALTLIVLKLKFRPLDTYFTPRSISLLHMHVIFLGGERRIGNPHYCLNLC
jgi:hypothetical protein